MAISLILQKRYPTPRRMRLQRFAEGGVVCPQAVEGGRGEAGGCGGGAAGAERGRRAGGPVEVAGERRKEVAEAMAGFAAAGGGVGGASRWSWKRRWQRGRGWHGLARGQWRLRWGRRRRRRRVRDPVAR